MITLTDKIRVRASVLWLLFDLFRPTMWIMVSMGIAAAKFYNYGLGMYPGKQFPKMMSLQDMIQIFVDNSITPLLGWLLISMVVERIALRPLFYKYVIDHARD